MSSLEVTWDGGSTLLEPGDVHTIGRGASATIRVEGRAVSRHHADLTFDGRAWIVTDRSSVGTYVGEDKITDHVLDGETTIRLGAPGAAEVVLRPEAVLGPVDQLRAPALDVDAGPSTGTIPLDDRALRLEVEGHHAVFQPGERAVVGRGESCDLRASSRLVSAEHCAFEHDGSSWTITDLDSTRGTFIDGRKVTGPKRIQGSLPVGLGDPSAADPLRVVTAGTHKPATDRRPLFLAGTALVVVIALVVGVVVIGADDSSGPNSSDQLAAAKAATVFIYGENDVSSRSGSGVLVAPDVVLTNRHVIEDLDRLYVAVSPGEDEPVEFEYGAEVAAIHPYLDLAVIRLASGLAFTDEGPTEAPLPDLDIRPLQVRSSEGLRVGDAVHSLGFPSNIVDGFSLSDDGQMRLAVTAVALGEVLSFAIWPGCTNPIATDLLVEGGASSECAPDGDLPRGNVIASYVSGTGGSGGPVVLDGRVIGINYAGSGGADVTGTAGTARNIPTEYFDTWLAEQL